MKNAFRKLNRLFLTLLVIVIGCSGGGSEMAKKDQPVYESLKDVPAAEWKKLSGKTIFFGHQSVGHNIIDGIQDVMKENSQIRLKVAALDKPENIHPKGTLVHGEIGKNRDPISKIDHFASILDSPQGKQIDMAVLKLCFIDIDDQTDINPLFEQYRATMKRLKSEHPRTKILHMTVPLSYSKTTWKTRLKKWIGKKNIWEYDSNIRKNEYNEMLNKQYAGKEPLFDLAVIESTLPDGTRSSFEKNGQTYYQLAPEYTFDEGHLNNVGRKIAAEQLLLFLVNNQ